MKSFTGLLKISTMSVALLASTAIVASVAMPDFAYAGNGNGKGNSGNGNSGNAGGGSDKGNSGKGNSGKGNSGKGNSGKSEASADKGKSAKSKGASAKREAKTKRAGNPVKAIADLFKKKSDAPKAKSVTRKKVAKTKRAVTKAAPKVTSAPKPRGNPLAQTLGVHPSELGALNAANASSTALANASPNSRVGKLAIYAGQVEATREMEAELIAAQELLDTLNAPERSGEEIDLALNDAETAKTNRQNDLAGLLADLEAAGGTDADIESEIEIASDDIVALDDEITALAQERADGEAYEEAAEDVVTLEEELADQADAQRAALEAAANKEVTDAVEAAVQSLLGIDQETVTEDDAVAEEDIASLD